MEEKTITFNIYELGAIGILVINEIYNQKKRLKENNFVYKEDKISCINFLQTLESINDKVNRIEKKEKVKY